MDDEISWQEQRLRSAPIRRLVWRLIIGIPAAYFAWQVAILGHRLYVDLNPEPAPLAEDWSVEERSGPRQQYWLTEDEKQRVRGVLARSLASAEKYDALFDRSWKQRDQLVVDGAAGICDLQLPVPTRRDDGHVIRPFDLTMLAPEEAQKLQSKRAAETRTVIAAIEGSLDQASAYPDQTAELEARARRASGGAFQNEVILIVEERREPFAFIDNFTAGRVVGRAYVVSMGGIRCVADIDVTNSKDITYRYTQRVIDVPNSGDPAAATKALQNDLDFHLLQSIALSMRRVVPPPRSASLQ